jgi:hypothetical protein
MLQAKSISFLETGCLNNYILFFFNWATLLKGLSGENLGVL